MTMSYQNDKNFPGSRWWKFDFHAHTGASDDAFKKSAYTAKAWLRAFMNAGIDCVAITDHNTAEGIDELKLAYEDLKQTSDASFRELFLFPAVEISVQGGVHLLAIFDKDKGRDDVRDLLTAVAYEGVHGKCDGVTEKSFNEVVDIIHRRGALAIPAHVDEKKGLFVEASGETLRTILRNKHISAMELRNAESGLPGLYEEEKINWTSVLGTDTHNFSDSGESRYPGSHFTWVKMEKPSFDGLRLALLDGSPSSVLRGDLAHSDPNAAANHRIERLEICSAKLMGRSSPLTLQFSPWLNTVIGGRGSGKSSLVEFARIALRREDELPEAIKKEFEFFSKISKDRKDKGVIQADTSIALDYRKDQTLYRIQWQTDGNLPSLEEWDGETWKQASGELVKERFPVSLFSQKQLFALSSDLDALLKRVDQVPEIAFSEWEIKWKEREGRYISALAQYRELKNRFSQKARIEGELDDVRKKLLMFEEAEHAGTLKQFQQTQRQCGAVEHFEEDTSAKFSAFDSALKEFVFPDFEASVFSDSEADQEIVQWAQASHHAFASAKCELDAVFQRMGDSLKDFENKVDASAWATHATTVKQAYDALVLALKAKGVNDPSEYGFLVQKRQKLESEIKNIEGIKNTMDAQLDIIKSFLADLESWRKDLSSRRTRFFESLFYSPSKEEERPCIRATNWSLGKDLQNANQQLRQILGCDEERFKRDILSDDETEGIIADLYRDFPGEPSAYESEIYKRLLEMKGKLISAHGNKEVEGIRVPFKNFLMNLPEETIDRLRCWYPKDHLEVEYKPSGKKREFQSIDSGSPGQRTAAMLAFILAYGDEPLVLDQPEDDLDNALITEFVVNELRAIKSKRQVIVVTHNPNIVVNGDSEWVIAMDSSKGECRIGETGGLQNPAIRRTICEIMEGGQKAFDERYRRIRAKA